MQLCGFQQLVIFYTPDFLIGPTSNICIELPESPIWIAPAQLRDCCEQIGTLLANHEPGIPLLVAGRVRPSTSPPYPALPIDSLS